MAADVSRLSHCFVDKMERTYVRCYEGQAEGKSLKSKQAGESKFPDLLRFRFLKSSQGYRRSSGICSTRRCARQRGRSSDTWARPAGSARWRR